MSARKIWWSCGCGYVELWLTRTDARSASHPGQCDADVAALSLKPYVAKQLAAISETDAARTVAEMFGDATPEELADHSQNLQRVLWLAAGDIAEGNV